MRVDDLGDCFDNLEQAKAEATLVLEELVSGDPIGSPIGLIEVRDEKGDCVSCLYGLEVASLP